MAFADEQLHWRKRSKRALWFALFFTAGFTIAEILAGLASRSLALLADAGHMFTDVFAIAFALFAFWMAEKPPTQRMSYGFHRAEILAALVNGIVLVNVVIFIFLEAARRLKSPPPVETGIMLAFAVLGMMVNLCCVFVLKGERHHSLNVAGVFSHVFGDFLASAGVLAAGLAIRFLGWNYADPLASMVIGSVVLFFAWALLRDSVSILLEAAPRHIDLAALEQALCSVRGVKDVHDLHVWSISSGREALSAHLDIGQDADSDGILREINKILEERFRIFHSTIQLESTSLPEKPSH
jgi:cobalt-zinc-cadmium efflux system protein